MVSDSRDKLFGTRRICESCQTPQSEAGFAADSDVCTACIDRLRTAKTLVDLHRGKDLWSQRLAEIKKTKTAAVPDEAEALQEVLGLGGLGRRLAEDIRSCRGEELTEEQKKLHTIPRTQLTQMYSIATKLLQNRDDVISDMGGGAFGHLTDEDLIAIVTQSTFERIKQDADFRITMLTEILSAEPDINNRMLEHSDAEGQHVT